MGALLSALLGSVHADDHMKLFNSKTGFVVVEFQDNQVIFHDRFLEVEMKNYGVSIPPAMRDLFQGKSAVRLKDKDFPRAFKEVYYPLSINTSVYQWDDRTS